MSNLKEIKNRIGATKSMRQVTRTMEMVSTAKIRGAQNRIEKTRPYVQSLARILSSVTRASKTVDHPLLAVRDEVKKVMVVSVASDRGQAGAFNANIIHLTEELIAEREALGQEIDLIACGRRVVDYFNNQGRTLDLQYQGFSGQPQLEDMKELAEYAIEQYSNAEIDEIVLVYNRFISVGTQRAESSTLLPATVGDLEAAVGTDATEQDSAAELEYLFEPNAEAILSTLLPAFVEMLVSRSLLESAASEHAARRAAMKAATDSAETMIKTLTRSYNRARQAAITTEIAEIVGGAAALED